MVVALLADDQLALHADAEVVARVAVRGREIGRTRELFGRGRRVVEQAEQRARDGVAHAEQHRLPRSLAQRRFVEREIERVGGDVHAECCEHARDPKTHLRVACDPMSEPIAADERVSFNSEMGFTYRIEEGLGLGWGWHADDLSVPGTDFPHASAMVTYADTLLGLLSSVATARLLADRRPALPDPLRASLGPIEMEGRLLKTGRTTTLGKTSFSVPGAALPFAICFGTFIGSPRPVDLQPFDRSRALSAQPDDGASGVTLTEPFTDRVGIRVIDAGVAEVDHRSDVLNSSNSIQGGVLAFVAEVAAQSLATAHGGRTFVVDDLDIRYLRAARSVPPREARLLHASESGVVVEVETRDRVPTTARCRTSARGVSRSTRSDQAERDPVPHAWERTPPPGPDPRDSAGPRAA